MVVYFLRLPHTNKILLLQRTLHLYLIGMQKHALTFYFANNFNTMTAPDLL